MLESLNGIGYGGAAGNRLNLVLQEIQSRRTEIATGAAAATAIACGTDRRDTIESVIMYAAGVPSDVTSEASAVDRRAVGTLTLTAVVAGDIVSVNGKAYTAVAFTPNGSNSGDLAPNSFAVGATDTLTAANLARKLNANDGAIVATSSAAVVTVRASTDGTIGNSIALVVTASNGHVARSASTLLGGTTTTGIKLSTTNSTGNKLAVTWLRKAVTAV